MAQPFAVGLSIWNRPKHSQASADALANAICYSKIPVVVYIHADGPRNSQEKALCAESLESVLSIFAHYEIEHKVIRQVENIGLSASVRCLAIEIFTKHSFAFFVEDDIVMSLQTIDFVSKLESIREIHNEVWSISAFDSRTNIKGGPNRFSKRFSSWGWCTWKDRWDLVQFNQDLVFDFFEFHSPYLNTFIIGKDWVNVAVNNIFEKNDSWAVYFQISSLLLGGKHLYPHGSYVANMGWDGSGVHCGIDNSLSGDPSKLSIRDICNKARLFPQYWNLRYLFDLNALPNRWTFREVRSFKKMLRLKKSRA